MGFIAKFADGVPVVGGDVSFIEMLASNIISIVGNIGTELGIWVFVATLVAAHSRYPLSAAINVPLFFLSMLVSYYIYGSVVLGFFPKAYFLGWLAVTLLTPIAGFCMWFSKAKGIWGSVLTALAVALLFSDGYSAFYTHQFSSFISLAMGIYLCILLPQTKKYKITALGISILVAFIFSHIYLIGFLPF